MVLVAITMGSRCASLVSVGLGCPYMFGSPGVLRRGVKGWMALKHRGQTVFTNSRQGSEQYAEAGWGKCMKRLTMGGCHEVGRGVQHGACMPAPPLT